MAALQEDKLQKPLLARYEFYTDILGHTLHYVDDEKLFNEFCTVRNRLSIKIHIQQSGKKPTERAIFDNYVIIDNGQLTMHNS
jgi:hypothetical protein